MYSFKQYLLHVESKNTHLEHVEDELINHGTTGVERALGMYIGLLDTLQGHAAEPVDINKMGRSSRYIRWYRPS